MYRLNVQVTACTDDKLALISSWSVHATHYKMFGAAIISLERLNINVVKFCTRVGYAAISILATGWHIASKRAWLFAVCRDAARRAGLSATAELLVFSSAC